MQNPYLILQEQLNENKLLLKQVLSQLVDNRPEYYTIEEAAEIIGCDIQTINRHIKKGHLKAKRFGPRMKRIPKEELFDNAGEVKSLRYKR